MSEEFLFACRSTRRDFLWTSSAALGVAASWNTLGQYARAEEGKPVTMGKGAATYTLDETFGKLPDGKTYGFGCAVVVDSKDNVYVTSRSANAPVAIFDKDGKLKEIWEKQLTESTGYTPEQIKATAHGLYWSKEGDNEYLYWTENVAGKGADRLGARVYKTDLQGKLLYTLGNVHEENEKSQKFDLTNPTDVSVAPNGDIYIVDGYGSQKLHHFDKNFKLIKTIGSKGKEHGQFNTNHGVWVNTLKKEPELYIADRANDRIEVFSLDLDYKRTIPGVRKPCCFYQAHGQLFIPELDKRVTILDEADQVVAHLGDGVGIDPKELERNPQVFATPHAVTVASNGDLYVIEWLPYARVRRFKHTPTTV
jgi:peptidylamidoglycolate lyase